MSRGINGIGNQPPIVQGHHVPQQQRVGVHGGHQYRVRQRGGGLPRPIPPIVNNPHQPIQQRSVRQQLGAGNMHLRTTAIFAKLSNRAQVTSDNRAGRPKDDVSFGFITFKKSTSYKNILSKLDSYHTEVSSPVFVSSKRQLAHMDEQLKSLSKATTRYNRGSSHTRKKEMTKLGKEVNAERKIVRDIRRQLASGGTMPDGMSLSQVMDYARAGISLRDMAGFHTRGIEPRVARGLVQVDVPPTQLKQYLDAGVSPQEAKILYDNRLDHNIARMYATHHLKVTPETLLKCGPGDVVGTPQKIGSGAFNTTFATNYQDGTTGVFKPLRAPYPNREHRIETGWVASRTGIDQYDPQIAMRNIATCAVADELGFDVVAKAEVGLQLAPPPGNRDPNLPVNQWQPQVGLVMEKAPGQEAKKTTPDDFNDPAVRKEITKLQLLDAITGQGDRHGGNYFIERRPNGTAKVTGIDNDQCFGKDLTDPNGIKQGTSSSNHGFRGCKLPAIVDSQMATAIESLTPGRLEQLLGDKLSPAEIDAAKQRLTGVKQHIRRLRARGRIIRPDQWGDRNVMRRNDKGSSYIVRDHKRAVRKQAQIQGRQARAARNQNAGQNDINQIMDNLGILVQ